MGLRFDPVGGGQFKEALKQIIEAESQPIKTLEGRKAREEAKLKLFQEFKGKFANVDKALQEISSFKKLRELKVDLGDGAEAVSVTVDKERAQPGTYSLEIEELAARTSAMSNGFEDPDDPVLGIGFVVMESEAGELLEVFIDDNNSSLRGIAATINQQPDSPVRASVIKDMTDSDAPWKLILAGKKDGAIHDLSLPDFYFLDGTQDIYVDYDREAQNALIKIDGFPIEAESNDIPDFVQGINVHLKQARPDRPVTITITEDFQKIGGKMKEMVDQLNPILDFINKQNQVDEKTDTSKTFAGDTSLQTIEYRIRNMMHERFPVHQNGELLRTVSMTDIGVEFNRQGQLVFKEDKFTKFMEADFDSLSQIVTGEFGFAAQMGAVMKGYSSLGGGMLAMREQSLRGRIKQIDSQIDMKTRNLERKATALTDKFARLQGTLSGMQQQQQYLQASMGGGGGGNIVQQLLGG
jgi:flagellar hook-associated protein 2